VVYVCVCVCIDLPFLTSPVDRAASSFESFGYSNFTVAPLIAGVPLTYAAASLDTVAGK